MNRNTATANTGSDRRVRTATAKSSAPVKKTFGSTRERYGRRNAASLKGPSSSAFTKGRAQEEHQRERHRGGQEEVHQQRADEASAEVVGARDGRGGEQRVHARLDVPQRGTAEERGRHQQAEHADDDVPLSDGGGNVRVQVAGAGRLLGEHPGGDQVREGDEHSEEDPRHGTPQPIPDFEAHDLEQLHAWLLRGSSAEVDRPGPHASCGPVEPRRPAPTAASLIADPAFLL